MRLIDQPGTIVVGVDGTDASVRALVFALREGRACKATVRVVTAGVDAREHALDVQDRAVAAALAEMPAPPVIARVLVEGEPVAALLEASRGALSLVLGRGRKGVEREGAVGSIVERCIREARCPVIVVPPKSRDGAPETGLLASTLASA